MAADGLVFAYHNHSFELEKYDGKTGLDILISATSRSVTFEIDTYWLQHGGADPAAWVAKLAGRVPLVHLKDMVVATDMHARVDRISGESADDFEKRVQSAKQPKPIMAEVGEGNMNWPAILQACGAAGVEWYIVEQDLCQRDPFESLTISLRNLHAMGIR